MKNTKDMTTFKYNFNKAQIFRQAHSIAKKQGVSFSEALQKAWFFAKRVATIAKNEFYIALRKAGLAKEVNTVAVSCPNQHTFITNTTLTGIYQFHND